MFVTAFRFVKVGQAAFHEAAKELLRSRIFLDRCVTCDV